VERLANAIRVVCGPIRPNSPWGGRLRAIRMRLTLVQFNVLLREPIRVGVA
jgi:hypothetical protein